MIVVDMESVIEPRGVIEDGVEADVNAGVENDIQDDTGAGSGESVVGSVGMMISRYTCHAVGFELQANANHDWTPGPAE